MLQDSDCSAIVVKVKTIFHFTKKKHVTTLLFSSVDVTAYMLPLICVIGNLNSNQLVRNRHGSASSSGHRPTTRRVPHGHTSHTTLGLDLSVEGKNVRQASPVHHPPSKYSSDGSHLTLVSPRVVRPKPLRFYKSPSRCAAAPTSLFAFSLPFISLAQTNARCTHGR